MSLRSASEQVFLANPGRTQFSNQAVLALQKEGLLACYETGFFYRPNPLLERWLHQLPSAFSNRILRELGRRKITDLPPDLIYSHPGWGLFHKLTMEFCPTSKLSLFAWKQQIRNFQKSVITHLKDIRPGAVIAYDAMAAPIFRAAKQAGIPCILDQVIAHLTTGIEIQAEEWQREPAFADSLGDRHPQLWRTDEACEEIALADWVIAPSEFVVESLLKAGVQRERILLIPFGVDTSVFTPLPDKPDTGSFRILFTGQLSQRKGIKYLLEAFKRLKLPQAELWLVGDMIGSGRGFKAYEGLFHHVHNIPHSEVHDHFQKADIFVFPSLYEGSALVTYEALASGLPVITTPNAGSVVRDGVEGFIVPIRDIDSLMARIEQLYRDKQLRREMSRNARKRAEEFTWTKYQQRYTALVKNILQHNPVHP